MWKACLSEAVVANILKKDYIVVSDPFHAQNNCSFGVRIWMYSADEKELRKYWYGTGNCLIGPKFTEEYHYKRVRELEQALTQAKQVAAGDLKAAAEVEGSVKSVNLENNTITVAVGYGANAKEQEFQLSLRTKVVEGIRILNNVTPIAGGLKSSYFAKPGAQVMLETITDKEGTLRVQEVRVTRAPRR